MSDTSAGTPDAVPASPARSGDPKAEDHSGAEGDLAASVPTMGAGGGRSPARVRVTSSRRTARHVSTAPMTREIDTQTTLGDVYVGGLMHAQLRLAAIVGLVALVGIAGFPLLLMLVPTTRTLTVLGAPFPWLVLGLLVYPVVWVLARYYDHQAARIEAEFTAEVEGADPADGGDR